MGASPGSLKHDVPTATVSAKPLAATMEALCTKLDELQWEVNRLEAENRKLREDQPGNTDLVDREAELNKSRREVAKLADRMRELERQLQEKTRAAADAGQRAEQAETQVEELRTEAAAQETREANSEAEVVDLRTAINKREEELASAHRELGVLDAKLVEQERQHGAAGGPATEGRTGTLPCEGSPPVQKTGDSGGGVAVPLTVVYTEDNGRLREEVQHLSQQLGETNTLVGSLRQANLELRSQLETVSEEQLSGGLPEPQDRTEGWQPLGGGGCTCTVESRRANA